MVLLRIGGSEYHKLQRLEHLLLITMKDNKIAQNAGRKTLNAIVITVSAFSLGGWSLSFIPNKECIFYIIILLRN